MNNKYVYLLMLTFTLMAEYPGNVVVIDGGKFEDLPEARKQKINEINEEFDNEAEFIFLNKNEKRLLNIYFEGMHPRDSNKIYNGPKNAHCVSFVEAIKSIKINNDSNSKINALEGYEKEGIKLIEKAGYLKRPGFSLKIDTESIYGYISEEGEFRFIEYYNGIEIDTKGSYIKFTEGRVRSLILYMFANDDMRIVGTVPKIDSSDALKKYLSSSNKLKLRSARTKLCYIDMGNALTLCWEITVSLESDSRKVYVNALTGKIEFDVSLLIR